MRWQRHLFQDRSEWCIGLLEFFSKPAAEVQNLSTEVTFFAADHAPFRPHSCGLLNSAIAAFFTRRETRQRNAAGASLRRCSSSKGYAYSFCKNLGKRVQAFAHRAGRAEDIRSSRFVLISRSRVRSEHLCFIVDELAVAPRRQLRHHHPFTISCILPEES